MNRHSFFPENGFSPATILTLIIGWILASVLPSHANVQMPTAEQNRIYASLQRMMWQELLTEEQETEVVEALTMKSAATVVPALKVVALHNIIKANTVMRQGVGVEPSTAEAARIIAASLVVLKEPITFLREQLNTFEVPDPAREEAIRRHSGYSKYSIIRSIIIIAAAKRIRAGKKTTLLEGLQLSSYEKKLIDYSKTPGHQSVTDIINKFSSIKIIGQAV